MFLEMIAAAGCGWYAAKKVGTMPHRIADTMTKAKTATLDIVDDIRHHLMSKAEREQARLRRNAQMMYDATVGEIFAHATDEEKQTILDLFAKYSQPRGSSPTEGS